MYTWLFVLARFLHYSAYVGGPVIHLAGNSHGNYPGFPGKILGRLRILLSHLGTYRF